MAYWEGGYVQDLLIVISLIAIAAAIRRAIPALTRLGMPDALIAGGLGIVLGPAALGLLPFVAEHLELVIYHALALVFIAVSLQSPPPGKRSGTALSISFAIPAIATLQGVIGLACVLGWNLVAGGPELHSGFSMMLPLGFNQGPPPAMTLGAAWEEQAGMTDGPQIGLIMAALGYAWCCVMGVVLVAFGRRRGWHLAKGRLELEGAGQDPDKDPDHPDLAPSEDHRPPPRRATPGGLEPLTTQLVAIVAVYLAVWIFLELVTPFIPAKFVSTVWGFHFLIGTGFAMAVRPLLTKIPGGTPLDDDLLARSASVLVDVATCAALAAVSLSVFGDYLGPLLLISSVGGVLTLLACVWMARRAFPVAPFHHAVVTFGSLTGTATTGMALLRMLDPELSGPAARNYVRGIPLSAVLGLPLFMMMPIPVLGFPDDYPGKALMVLGLLLAYVVVLIVLWRVLAPLRFGKTPWKIWPKLDGD